MSGLSIGKKPHTTLHSGSVMHSESAGQERLATGPTRRIQVSPGTCVPASVSLFPPAKDKMRENGIEMNEGADFTVLMRGKTAKGTRARASAYTWARSAKNGQ
jgi:hypothetical protein